jgi:hypothetical protein
MMNIEISIFTVLVIAFLKPLQRLKQDWAGKSSPETRQTDLVWFGEIERKLAKLSMPTFL